MEKMIDEREKIKNLSPETLAQLLGIAQELEKKKAESETVPWWDGKHLDEVAFCRWFSEKTRSQVCFRNSWETA